MKIYKGSEKIDTLLDNPVIALGNFDGVHLGHQYLLKKALMLAKNKKTKCVVYTFDPHPADILAPKGSPKLIQTFNQKMDSLESLGIDYCVVENFTTELASLTPKEFVKDIIIKRLKPLTIVIGYDFTFGVHRSGDISFLQDIGKKFNIEIETVPAQFLENILLSSTEIRNLILSGKVKIANTLLGRFYSINGKVVKGKGIGRSLGAHTANIETDNHLIPANGIYLTNTLCDCHSRDVFGRESSISCHCEESPTKALKDRLQRRGNPLAPHPSITSIGTNPTFHDNKVTIETHLIDFKENLLDKNISIEFIEKIRDQKAFASAKELKEQIAKDINIARKLHKGD